MDKQQIRQKILHKILEQKYKSHKYFEKYDEYSFAVEKDGILNILNDDPNALYIVNGYQVCHREFWFYRADESWKKKQKYDYRNDSSNAHCIGCKIGNRPCKDCPEPKIIPKIA